MDHMENIINREAAGELRCGEILQLAELKNLMLKYLCKLELNRRLK